MTTKQFWDVDQANMYLSGSIVRFNGEPVYVGDIMWNEDDDEFDMFNGANVRYLAEFRPIGTEEWQRRHLGHEMWDFEPVPTGYMNYIRFAQPGWLYSILRMPVRAWKIGLTQNNAHIAALGERHGRGHRDLLNSRFFTDMVTDKYPKYEELLGRIGEDKAFIAFSREWALKHGGTVHNVMYDEPVGKINEDNGTIELADQYKYLSESLTEDINR